MIADTFSNKKLSPLVTQLFIRGRKLILENYPLFLSNFKLNSTHYFLIKISNKSELQQITFNHSSDINFQNFMNLYKKFTTKPYSFLVIDTTLASDNSSHFRKNLLERI